MMKAWTSPSAFSLADDGRSGVFTPRAAGPWSPGHCHGGAVAALVVHAAEAHPSLAPMEVARLTLELHRPVPVAAVDVGASVVREGRKLQLLELRLSAEGVEVARASVLRLRVAEQALPPGAPQPAFEIPPPEAGVRSDAPSPDGFGSLFELRSARGAFRKPGPASIWFRPQTGLAADRPRSAAAVAAAVADFSNGVSSVLPFEQWTFVNADLTVSLARPPDGEWVLLDAVTLLGGDGRALAVSRLADRRGWLGSATQSVLLERRAGT